MYFLIRRWAFNVQCWTFIFFLLTISNAIGFLISLRLRLSIECLRKLNVEHPTSNCEWAKMKKQAYDLEERLLEFSVRIIKIVEQLSNTRTANHVAGQLLRSGTSPYPNHGEAQAAESPKDFIHKLRISLKELRETQRWLRLIQRVPLIEKPELLNDILEETEELIRIFVTSIKTAKKNQE